MVEALCPELLLEVLSSQYLSFRSQTLPLTEKHTSGRKKTKCAQKKEEYPKLVEALCLELLVEVLRSQYLSFRNQTLPLTEKHTSEEKRPSVFCFVWSVYKRKAEYPKVAEALCLELLLQSVEVPVPFISKSNTTTDNKTYM